MWDALREKKLGVRILLGVVVFALGGTMLLYLVPQGINDLSGAENVAEVGGQAISVVDVQNLLSKNTRSSQIPPALLPAYTQQALDQLVNEKILSFEADRMGLRVSDEEHADFLKKLVPTAFAGDTFVGMDKYSAEVQTRFQVTVPEFETEVKNALLQQKFEQLVTDGIRATDDEVRDEFRRENEKIKLDYVLIKPDDLQAKIDVPDADLAAFFDKNKAQYVIPDRRTVDYAVLSMAQLRLRSPVTDDEQKLYYQSHIDQYKVEERSHVAHILFKTVGKTDAEAAEIKKKAEDVLNKAKHGGNFADLAKQNSEDTSKDKGGDLGWIVRGQTVPEFEAAAFSIPPGFISDLVKTQYGFHIIKVIEREPAHTQTLDEVKPNIIIQLQTEKAEQLGDTLSTQIADEIRRSGRIPIEDLAKKFNMTTGEAKLVEAIQLLPELGNAPGLMDGIFHQRMGDVSSPIRTDQGIVVTSVKDIQPSHPATLNEVHDRVATDFRHGKAVELAKSRAEELAKRAKGGENFNTAAKSLGFDVKTSDPVSRTGSIPEMGSSKQFPGAFTMTVGELGDPLALGVNWAVYRVAEHDAVSQDDYDKQKAKIEDQVLQRKRQTAYELFRTALKTRLEKEGQLQFNADNLKRLINPS